MKTIDHFKAEIKEVVARVSHNFEWYKKLVEKSGYDECHDYSKLPFVDEAILNQFYYNADSPGAEQFLVYYTSGTSSGKRKRILYSKEDHLNYVAQRKNIFSRFITADCKVVCSDLGTGHAASSANEIFEGLGLQSYSVDYRRPASEHVELLNKYQPDVLFTMPIILDSILHVGNLSFRPKKLIVVGDVASKTWKEYIVDYFGLKRSDLLDIYGSIEAGSIAYECFDCGFYHFDDHIIPEIVKSSDYYEDFNYYKDAEILVLTSTTRTVFPAIRFVTNDLLEGFKARECKGETYFTFERIIGRIGSEIKNGEKISLYDICEAVNTFLPGGLFDITRKDNKFIIKVSSRDFTLEKAEKVRAYVKNLNPEITRMIESSLVDEIEVYEVNAEELPAGMLKKSFPLRKTDKPCAE
ncbi:MAG TPA: hypothetical protein VNI02_14415 [Blastocatellia bacterium]|jgi:phenylacetate-coenzyme A ligase PaaK-like adenylate-forming protein|nr:hypothetical protein [Blastocatellia bacterium]